MCQSERVASRRTPRAATPIVNTAPIAIHATVGMGRSEGVLGVLMPDAGALFRSLRSPALLGLIRFQASDLPLKSGAVVRVLHQ